MSRTLPKEVKDAMLAVVRTNYAEGMTRDADDEERAGIESDAAYAALESAILAYGDAAREGALREGFRRGQKMALVRAADASGQAFIRALPIHAVPTEEEWARWVVAVACENVAPLIEAERRQSDEPLPRLDASRPEPAPEPAGTPDKESGR